MRLAAPAVSTAAERERVAREPELLDGVGLGGAEDAEALLQLSDSTSSLSSDSIQRRKRLQQYLASHPRTPVSIERSAARAAATSSSSKPRAQPAAAELPNSGSGDAAGGSLRVRVFLPSLL